MSKFASADEILFALSILGYIVLLVRLWTSGLVRTYRAFSLYLLFQLVRSAFMFSLRPRTNFYAWSFFVSESVVWVLSVLVVFELQRLAIEKYQGISTAGRKFLSAALGISVVLSLLAVAPEMSAGPGKFPALLYFMTAGRAVASMLVVSLVLLSGFMAWFPIPAARNVLTHMALFFVYFLAKNIGLLMWNLAGPGQLKSANTAFQAVACGCLLVWAIRLNQQGEAVRRTLVHRSRQEDAERLVGQLEALNATLARNRRG